MKLLLNVALDAVRFGEWIECEAVKLVEQPDGSLELHVATDLELVREAEAHRCA